MSAQRPTEPYYRLMASSLAYITCFTSRALHHVLDITCFALRALHYVLCITCFASRSLNISMRHECDILSVFSSRQALLLKYLLSNASAQRNFRRFKQQMVITWFANSFCSSLNTEKSCRRAFKFRFWARNLSDVDTTLDLIVVPTFMVQLSFLCAPTAVPTILASEHLETERVSCRLQE
jgi:hypothetical protein